MTQTPHFDTIVIGAGLGGLVAGARLAKNGQRVLVLEQHYIPGGCATSFKRRDFLMEVGLHELDGLDAIDPKKQLFEELGIADKLELQKVPQFYRALNTDKTFDLTLADDVSQAAAELSERFPSEKRGIGAYFSTMSGIRRELLSLLKLPYWVRVISLPIFPLFFPRTVMATGFFSRWTARLNPLFWLLRPKLALFGVPETIGEFLDKKIHSDPLKTLLLANLGYYHDDPYSMSILYYSAAQAGYYQGGYYIKGGSQKLSDLLTEVIRSHQGTVVLGKKVERILVDKGKVKGVCYANSWNGQEQAASSEVFANSVVVNAAVPNLVKMLPEAQSRALARRIRHLQPSCSLLSIYMGFKVDLRKDLDNKAYSTFLIASDLSPRAYSQGLQQDPTTAQKNCIFVDYSQIDSGIAPVGKSVGVICAVDYMHHWEGLSETQYKAKKERVAQNLIGQLESVIPGISQAIEYYDVATPRTIEHYTLNPGGAPYGFAQTPWQSGLFRFPLNTLLPNLYFASAWSTPGGGFTGAILSGMECSKLMLRKARRTPPTVTSHQLPDTQKAQLVEQSIIAENTIELVFTKAEDFSRYQPGQYAVVRIDKPRYTKLDMPLRSLSMVSHPDESYLRFAMRTSDSAYKRSAQAMKPGDTVTLYGPMGSFCLRENTGREQNKGIVFLASGIGITPVLAMLKELQKRDYAAPVYLYYSNRSKKQTAYDQEIRSLVLTDFTYRPVFTRARGGKRIDDALLRQDISSFEGLDYYIVGADSFARSMEELLLARAVAGDSIHIDSFG